MRPETPVRRRAHVPLYRYSSFWFSLAIGTFAISTLFAVLQKPRDPYEPLRLDDARGWLTPVDPGRASELPSVTADLRAVYVDPNDSRRVWAAGNAGTIVFSSDGGQTWTRQEIRAAAAAPPVRAGAKQ